MSTIQTARFGPVDVDEVGYADAGTMTAPMLGADGECIVEFFDLGPDDAAAIDAALDAFAKLGPADRDAVAPRVLANCRNFLDAIAYDEDDDEVRAIETPDEVWAFVTPERIQLAPVDNAVHVALVCQCEWEREHGLQLVYRDGRELVRVSAADGDMAGRSD